MVDSNVRGKYKPLADLATELNHPEKNVKERRKIFIKF